jgi:putative ABC transport system permease protein
MAIPLTYNVRNLRVRWVTTLLTLGGIAAVTAMFVMMFAMGLGVERALTASGHPLNLIALRTGTTAESQSLVTKRQVDDLLSLPGIPRDEKGEPLVSAELVVVANLPKADGGKANAAIRGAGPQAAKLRDGLKLTEGRWFKPSLGEVVVGRGVVRRFQGLGLGAKPVFRGREWTVVGVFECDGQAYESEIWGDLEDIRAQFKRDYSAVLIRVRNPGELERLSRVILEDKQFKLDAKPHLEYYEKQNLGAQMLKAIASVMGVVLSIGAVFGAANTMYAAVAQRTREIATMRVLGFTRLSIWASFVIESAVLGAAGGLLGVAASRLIFDGITTGTVNWQSFSELAFQFRVTPELMGTGLGLATLLGMVGGFFPAWRASRVPIARALRGL